MRLNKKELNDEEGINYKRLQIITHLSLDSTTESNINGLKDAGNQMWDENEDDLKKIIMQICDEKYG